MSESPAQASKPLECDGQCDVLLSKTNRTHIGRCRRCGANLSPQAFAGVVINWHNSLDARIRRLEAHQGLDSPEPGKIQFPGEEPLPVVEMLEGLDVERVRSAVMAARDRAQGALDEPAAILQHSRNGFRVLTHRQFNHRFPIRRWDVDVRERDLEFTAEMIEDIPIYRIRGLQLGTEEQSAGAG